LAEPLRAITDPKVFAAFLAPLRDSEWVVYAKAPFAGPEPVLRYLSRYTHRVAISNRRLVADDKGGVAFRWKDYRLDGPHRWKTMALAPHEFIRRFLMHVLPKGFHRIRHYGLLANGNRAADIARLRALLRVPPVVEAAEEQATTDDPRQLPWTCLASSCRRPETCTRAALSSRSKVRHRMAYSITSSACASSVGGTVMPAILAVLRLITSSYFVGSWIGRSATFSPLNIRSTYDAAPL
jgi:hypothetical protein